MVTSSGEDSWLLVLSTAATTEVPATNCAPPLLTGGNPVPGTSDFLDVSTRKESSRTSSWSIWNLQVSTKSHQYCTTNTHPFLRNYIRLSIDLGKVATSKFRRQNSWRTFQDGLPRPESCSKLLRPKKWRVEETHNGHLTHNIALNVILNHELPAENPPNSKAPNPMRC